MKPLSTKQFIKKKNKLVKKVTGKILVPKNQIVNEPKTTHLTAYSTYSTYLDSSNCPYCAERTQPYTYTDCSTCPMALAGNICSNNPDSTWIRAATKWADKSTEKDHKKLIKLIKRYNMGI